MSSKELDATPPAAAIADAPNDLLRLIERLGQATEGSRELDAEIWLHSGDRYAGIYKDSRIINADRDYRLSRAPTYTTSIDAALTLVPEGCAFYRLNQYSEGANLQPWGWGAHVRKPNTWIEVGESRATAALALCIAALKARAAIEVAVPAGPNGAVSPDPIDGGKVG